MEIGQWPVSFATFVALQIYIASLQKVSDRQDAKEGFVITEGQVGNRLALTTERAGMTVLAKTRQDTEINKDADLAKPINITVRFPFIKTAPCPPAPSVTPLHVPQGPQAQTAPFLKTYENLCY